VRARDERQVVEAVELFDDVGAKEVARAARREAPPVNVLGVGPHEVAHGALVRHLDLAVQHADLVQRVDGGRQAAVHAEDAVLDERGEREVVKDVDAVAPHVDGAVLAQALVVEAVDLRDLARLVVAADERDAVGVAHLEREQQQERLDAVVAAVHKVAQEDVVRVGALAAHLEQLNQVVELPVDVAADLGRRRAGAGARGRARGRAGGRA